MVTDNKIEAISDIVQVNQLYKVPIKQLKISTREASKWFGMPREQLITNIHENSRS